MQMRLNRFPFLARTIAACGVAVASAGLSGIAAADVQVYDNGVFITGVGTGTGGTDVSRAESSVITIGFNANAAPPSGPIRLADDFTLSAAGGEGGVRLSHMYFYGVQSNSVTTDVRFGAFYITLYDGNPSAGGNPIAGDFTTNRLLSSTWTGAYRLSSSGTFSSSRPITRLDVDMSWAPRLASGTYWMVVSAVGDGAIATTPNPQSIFVTPHPDNANALQYFNSTWFAIWDLPFKQFAFCPGDYNKSHGVDVQDIFDFLAGWFASNPAADFNGADGITVQDIFDFLAAWFAGC
jgi:hypothetical protein